MVTEKLAVHSHAAVGQHKVDPYIFTRKELGAGSLTWSQTGPEKQRLALFYNMIVRR
jgi:hypothetical protein